MAYFNDPNGYRPVGHPMLPGWEFANDHASELTEVGSLYFRDLNHRPSDEEILRLLNDPGSVDLRAFQYWVDLGWKAKHGTRDAAIRLTGKFIEESNELYVEVNKLSSNDLLERRLEIGEVSEARSEATISECGDVKLPKPESRNPKVKSAPCYPC
jgi:hypothetical protein